MYDKNKIKRSQILRESRGSRYMRRRGEGRERWTYTIVLLFPKIKLEITLEPEQH